MGARARARASYSRASWYGNGLSCSTRTLVSIAIVSMAMVSMTILTMAIVIMVIVVWP